MLRTRLLAGLAGPILLAFPTLAQRPPGGGGDPDPIPPTIVGQFPVVAVPRGNPLTPEKVLLGKALFFEEQLSSDDTVACATCHVLEAGGVDPRLAGRAPGSDGRLGTFDDELGSPGVRRQDALGRFEHDPVFGVERQVTGRSAPSVINAAFFNQQFWDSRAGPVFRDLDGNVVLGELASLESQAVGPPLSAVEMAHAGRDWRALTAKLARVRPLELASDLPVPLAQFVAGTSDYRALFERVFGSAEITRERIAMAIASYERTLVSDGSPFDLGTLTPRQQLGLEAFLERGTCAQCHTAENGLFTDGKMDNVHLPGHDRAVKNPGLRNLAPRPRFMSSGQFASMAEVLQHYEDIGALTPLPGDLEALEDFLLGGLTDPRVVAGLPPFDRPTLFSERVPSGANLYGASSPGSGGVHPRMLADAPPYLGNPEFQLGLGAARGATLAALLVSPQRAAPGAMLLGVPLAVDLASAHQKLLPVSRAGAGQGTATHRLALPSSTAALGRRFHAQWIVLDPGAPRGLAATRGAELELFARP
ncbi:MAG TPA: cytochrome-c peroxidase [Planctomycetota bacterium]